MEHGAANSWTILCDFDGTVSHDDATDTLLERHGRPGWQALEAQWKANRLGSRDCMAGQVALLDMDTAALEAAVDSLNLDTAFPAFVEAAQRAGHHLVIVSDGIDHVIRRSLARLGLAGRVPIVANRLVGHGPRDWRLEFPHAVRACRRASGTCKCAVADWMLPRRRTLLVGDGASDFCVSGVVDLVFAKSRLIDHCLVNAIPHHPIASFADALPLLADLQREDAVARAAELLSTSC